MALTDAPRLDDPEILACPYETYERLREKAPVFRDPATGTYVISRYEDVRRILLDPVRFGSEGYLDQVTDAMLAERAERVRALYRERGWLPGPALGFIDEPRHGDVRAIFDKAFRAGRIREMDPQIRNISYEIVDDVLAEGQCDFVDRIAIPIPLRVSGLITTVPDADLPDIRRWTEAFIRRFGLMISEEEERECVLLEIEAQHYLMDIIERLRAKPEDNLLSDIVNTPMSDGSLLGDNDLLAHLMADTFVGGSETTTSALASGVLMLARDPDLFERIAADPDKLLRPFIEEVLRLESPVQGLYRVAREEIEMHGVTIPAGSVLNLRYAAANRDDAKFDDPEELDIDRKAAGAHLAFGSGIHHCVGATLARRELFWGFRAVVDRMRNLRLAPGHEVAFAPSLMLRRLENLPITFDVRDDVP